MEAGRSFGPAAGLYDRARPGYSDAAVRFALPERVGRLLDLGAGTGKLTSAVLPFADAVVAVDPSAEMLERLRAKLPAVEVRQGSAERTGLPDESVDAVVVGAAFHWFTRPDAESEVARILRPGGPVTLLWNAIDPGHAVYEVFAGARRRAGLSPAEVDDQVTLDPRWFAATERRAFFHDRLVTGHGSLSARPAENTANEEKDLPMAATLQEILLAPDTKPMVIADCHALIGEEISDKSGVSGAAVKLAYKTVAAFAPGYIDHMLEVLLPRLVDKLQPYWADFNVSGGSEFGDYLAKRSDEVAEALLSVTDARAAASKRPTIIRAYRSVRGSAAKHVAAALPRVGELVVTYAA